MMYSEFIEKTGYSETYITDYEYHTFIEPAYMEAPDEIDKTRFCKDFVKKHHEAVDVYVTAMIANKSLEDKEAYINGKAVTFKDVEGNHTALKIMFLGCYRGIAHNMYVLKMK